MRVVLDVENSVTKRNGKDHMDPFEPSNELVQVGMLNADDHKQRWIVNLNHDEAKDTTGKGRNFIQQV